MVTNRVVQKLVCKVFYPFKKKPDRTNGKGEALVIYPKHLRNSPVSKKLDLLPTLKKIFLILDEFLFGFSVKEVLDHRFKTSGEMEFQVVGLYDEKSSSRWLSLKQIGSGIQIAEQYLIDNDLEVL
jgi:hypothetical protein